MTLRRTAAPAAAFAALLLAGCFSEKEGPTPTLTLSTGPDRVTASQTSRNDLHCKIGYTLHNNAEFGLFDVRLSWRSLNYGGEGPPVARVPPDGDATGAIDIVLPPSGPDACDKLAADFSARVYSCRSFDGDCPDGDVPRR